MDPGHQCAFPFLSYEKFARPFDVSGTPRSDSYQKSMYKRIRVVIAGYAMHNPLFSLAVLLFDQGYFNWWSLHVQRSRRYLPCAGSSECYTYFGLSVSSQHMRHSMQWMLPRLWTKKMASEHKCPSIPMWTWVIFNILDFRVATIYKPTILILSLQLSRTFEHMLIQRWNWCKRPVIGHPWPIWGWRRMQKLPTQHRRHQL